MQPGDDSIVLNIGDNARGFAIIPKPILVFASFLSAPYINILLPNIGFVPYRYITLQTLLILVTKVVSVHLPQQLTCQLIHITEDLALRFFNFLDEFAWFDHHEPFVVESLELTHILNHLIRLLKF